MHFTSDMSYAVLRVVLQCLLCIGIPTVIKITASHDFLGGLAAFIFTAGSRLAAFSRPGSSFPDRHKNHSIYTSVFLHLPSLPIQLVRMRIHKTSAFWNRMLCSVFCLCLPWRFINWCEHASFLYNDCCHQRVIAFLTYSNACSSGLARTHRNT